MPAPGPLTPRRLWLHAALASSLGSPWLARAQGAPLAGASLYGQGSLTFLGFVVYQALLWTRPGFEPARYADHTFALELRYQRTFRAAAIASRSLQEMQRIAPIEAAQARRWEAELASLLPDVAPGDTLVGVHRPGVGAEFLSGGRLLGQLRQADFSARFFGIWLHPGTSEPTLRRRLLGLSELGDA